ncbi:MAG: glycosyltransferase family 2 protein [Sphingomonadaceae bacterium]|nr:glycosyltransferase family 2 protein [Sphingomonadaceae bacterium]
MHGCTATARAQLGEWQLVDQRSPTVTVVVPAHNAAATIGETLTSVVAQAYHDWELVIVDDGSTDATADIARHFCASEPRARLLTQANGGVARARNRGLADARTRWVAPIDADDIWHPTHLSRLITLAHTASDTPTMLFAQSRQIDARSNVLHSPVPYHVSGPAFALMAMRNIVGNGSALLLDRDAALAVGGYDARLRDAGREGCEDLLLQLRLAARHPIMAAPAHTVGHRQLPHTMSKNVETMCASQQMARALLMAEEPAARHVPKRFWRWASAGNHTTLFRSRLRRGQLRAALAALGKALSMDPAGSMLTLASDIRRAVAHLLGYGRASHAHYRHFMDVPPDATGVAMFDPLVRTGVISALERRRQADALAWSAMLMRDTGPAEAQTGALGK